MTGPSADIDRTTAGFTLIETLVVVVVIALAVSIALPYARTLSPSARLEAQAARVLAVLRATRALAIRTSDEQSVVIDADLLTIASSATTAVRIDPDINLRVTFAERERPSASQGGIRYFPNGQSTGGLISLSLGTLTTRLTINWATGHASIEH